MIHDRDDRSGSYRRRLARAAAASFALHMLLFGGLSVSRLELAGDRPDDPKAATPQKPKQQSDFRLQVSRSAATNRPAHEQPLTLELPPAAAPAAQARERQPERNLADRRETAPEAEPVVTPSDPAFERSRPSESASLPSPTAAPARAAEAAAADASAAADMAAAAAATEAASQPAAVPAAAAPRDRGDSGAVAARWRPREVALLEKLTARPPEAAALAARAPLATAAPAREESLSRQATAASGGAAARADAIAAAASQAQPAAAPTTAAAPAARETARRRLQPTTTASRSANAAAEAAAAPAVASSAPFASLTRSRPAADAATQPTAAGRSPARAMAASAGQAAGTASMAGATAGSTAAEGSAAGAGGGLAPAALASGRSGRQAPRGSAVGGGSRAAAGGGSGASDGSEAAAAGLGGRLAGGTPPGGIGSGLQAGREGIAGAAAFAGGGSRSPGRDSGSGLAAATGSLAAVALPTAGSDGGGSGSGDESDDTTGTSAGSRAAALGGSRGLGSGESLLPAAVERSSRRGGGRSALAGRGGGDAAADGEAEEGLSVSPADIAALVAAGRERGGLAPRPAGPQPLERITAAALPADGRVRDVAEAFAGRSGTAGEPAGGITDRETLDRARRMVDRGLVFLARSQQADGRWRLTEFAGITPADVPKLDSDTAATGLALLSFLGAGHDHFSGPHRDTVRRGLEFLLVAQKDDGDLFLPADDLSNSCSWLYSHGIAAIAVCEAVGMTGDPLLKPTAEKACRFITTSRHPTLGGWRYIPRTDADLSVSGWMLVALRAGELGGVPTDPAAMGGVRTLLAASSSPSDSTRFAYNARKADQRRTDLSVACMTAVGTLMRLHTGTAADDPGVAAAARLLAGFPPDYGTRTQRVRDSYLWYYASQVLVHTGGVDWQRWYGSLVDTLEPRQRADGPLAGSWDALGEVPDRWGEYGGRLYVTTLHLLALEVPWRHLPTSTPAR